MLDFKTKQCLNENFSVSNVKSSIHPKIDGQFSFPLMATIARRQELLSKYNECCEMKVSDIRFTQKSVNDTFSNGTPIKWTINMLKTGRIKPYEIPLIRVADYNGYYKSVDNRRLYCYKQCGFKTIPVTFMESATEEFRCKDQSTNDGLSVEVISDPKHVSSHKNKVFAYNPITNQTRTWSVKNTITSDEYGYVYDEEYNDEYNEEYNDEYDMNEYDMNEYNDEYDDEYNDEYDGEYEDAIDNDDTKKRFFSCDVCQIKIQWHDKQSHLNGRKHAIKLSLNNRRSTEFESELSQKSKEIKTLNKKLSDLQQKYFTASTANNKLRNDLSKFSAINNHNDLKIKTMHKTANSLRSKLSGLQIKNKSLLMINEKLHKELSMKSANDKRHISKISKMSKTNN
eukprot:328091_1